MKLSLTASGVLALAGIAVAGYAAWRAYNAAGGVVDAVGQGIKDAASAVNPLNPDNIFATAGNTAISAATGREETLGGWFYDLTHADPVAAGAPKPAANTGGATGSWGEGEYIYGADPTSAAPYSGA